MGCTLGAVITVGLTFWLGWPIGTIIGVVLFVVVEWALMKEREERETLQDEANRRIVGR